VDLRNLADKAKELIDKRGGTGSLKEDADELRGIASRDESLVDKAKDAVEAVKDPGADATAEPAPAPTEAPEDPVGPGAEAERGEGRERGGQRRGKGGHGRGGGRGQGRGGGGGRGRHGGRDGDPAV
jgi:hypothetical protein